MNYLLDTNICIPIINGKDPELRRRIKQLPTDALAICSVVKAELLYGLKKSQNRAANEQRLFVFLSELPSLPFDDSAAEQFAIVRTMLEQSGKVIGSYDMMIAAIAQARGLTLATRNVKEFERIPTLNFEVW